MLMRMVPLLFFLAFAPAWGNIILVNDSERGSVDSDGSSNGANANNFFFAGFFFVQERNWFEFSIPAFSGTLASATFNLDQPQFGHQGGPLLYSVYALGGEPAHFSDVNSTTLFGSVKTDSTTDGSLVSITLGAAALEAISENEGGNFFIGGIDSGENSSSFTGDFASSNNFQTFLKLTTVPEPGLGIPIAFALLTLAGARIVSLHRKAS
jgi:hypothetical protein